MVDIGSISTSEHLFDLMVHLITNMDEGLCPHSTTMRAFRSTITNSVYRRVVYDRSCLTWAEIWQLDRNRVHIIVLGKLDNSKYLNNNNTLPNYLINNTGNIAT